MSAIGPSAIDARNAETIPITAHEMRKVVGARERRRSTYEFGGDRHCVPCVLSADQRHPAHDKLNKQGRGAGHYWYGETSRNTEHGKNRPLAFYCTRIWPPISFATAVAGDASTKRPPRENVEQRVHYEAGRIDVWSCEMRTPIHQMPAFNTQSTSSLVIYLQHHPISNSKVTLAAGSFSRQSVHQF